MPSARRRATAVIAVTAALAAAAVLPAPAGAAGVTDGSLASAFRSTSRSTDWELVEALPLAFDAFHPQGLVRVGDRLFLSSVEILEPTERYPEPVDGYDRSPGRGVGHLFVLDLEGNLLQDLVLGEGDSYHPGGIDSDGTSVWVPVAEYRPDSRSIVYRVDLASLEVQEVFRVEDHIGGVVHDSARGTVHGVSWGSRRLYTWTSTGRELARQANGSHFIDYQDCQGVAGGQMLCGGIATIENREGEPLELGGLALLDLGDGRVVHEVPVAGLSPAGHVLTRNPVHVEAEGTNLVLWAAPDDGDEAPGAQLLRYEATVG